MDLDDDELRATRKLHGLINELDVKYSDDLKFDFKVVGKVFKPEELERDKSEHDLDER